jgi:hypothetical protein
MQVEFAIQRDRQNMGRRYVEVLAGLAFGIHIICCIKGSRADKTTMKQSRYPRFLPLILGVVHFFLFFFFFLFLSLLEACRSAWR